MARHRIFRIHRETLGNAQSPRFAAGVLAVLLAAAAPSPAALAEATVTTAPTQVAPGQVLAIMAKDFPGSTTVEIGAGPPRSEYRVIETVRTNVEGSLTRRYTVSSHADTGTEAVIVVATEDFTVKAASKPVKIIAPEPPFQRPTGF